VHSKEDYENLKNFLPEANAKQSPHPTYEVFYDKIISKEISRNHFGISGNTILFFGFVRPYKGLEYLIESIPLIIKHMDLNLLVVGEFWEEESKYKKQIERLKVKDNIKLIDKYVPNEEVALYFAAADVVVLPYISVTGSGIVQLAFGCNTPVITTNVGSLPEVVSNGNTGLIVNPSDSSAIANAVLTFYEKNMEKVFIKNIRTGKKQFSWDKMIETIESFTMLYLSNNKKILEN
jgi:glycosyltransferase involved in cell wall biosynthesis